MPNQRWSLDFVSDQLTDGRRLRTLTVVDDCTRECLALIADTSLSGARVARELATLFDARGKPQTIVSDNGTEFTSNATLRDIADVLGQKTESMPLLYSRNAVLAAKNMETFTYYKSPEAKAMRASKAVKPTGKSVKPDDETS